MRIACFVTNFPKLSEVFILNQVQSLLDKGHDVQVFSLHDPGESIVAPRASAFVADGRVRNAAMPRGGLARVFGLCGRLPRFSGREARACLDVSRFGKEAWTLRTWYRLDAVRDALSDFHIAHAQFGEVGLQCAMLRELGVLRAPLVTSFRGNDLSGYVSDAAPGVYRAVFDNSAFCLPVAQRWRRRLIELGCSPDKVRVLPSGIPVERIPRREPGRHLHGGFPAIMSACRLEPHKGIDHALDAFVRVSEALPQATWDIYGDGPERPRLERKAADLGLAHQVRWHGPVAQETLLARLAEADVHWFTSVTLADGRTEGVPNILKESQAAGLPAIAFDHPGVSEVIEPGETGLLVSEGDVAGLAKTTIDLASNPALLDRMGEKARLRARPLFDLATITSQLETIYRQAIVADSAATRPGS